MKKLFIYVVALLAFANCNSQFKKTTVDKANGKEISIPFGGNAFVTTIDATSQEKITDNGLENWTSTKAIISCYFKINNTGKLNLSLKLQKAINQTEIKVSLLNKSYFVKVEDNKTEFFIGTVNIEKIGYLKVDVQAIKKGDDEVAENPLWLISGAATDSFPTFANDKENFYWSRRGPSCHLNYKIPKQDIEYFYSEIIVPKGEDKIGSYFMANGFSDGYFGIQVNSETERRVLFSVWEEENKPKTLLLKKGPNVTDGRFDGEGTGGQSYMLYSWKPDITYKFLTKGVPDEAGNTIYTSWFFVPEKNNWQLIASFKRQSKATYLKNLHSFIENFEDDLGYLGRKAFYGNQWVKIKNGNWLSINECTFSVDATGKNRQRMDFNGGVEKGKFFLQNGGFINNKVIPNAVLNNPNTNIAPQINVE